jgi:hypothetical protein
MRDLEDFLPLIQPHAVSAPEPVIFRCLRDAAIRFCERTRLWRCFDTITTTGTDPEPISMPPDAVLFEIAACSIDGRPLDPISLMDLAGRHPNWRTADVGSGGARYYVSPEFGTVQAVPRTAGTITVEFIGKPTADAQTLPDFLFDLYGPTIADGASGAVLLMPSTAFANPTLGAGLTARFEQKLDSLSGSGRRGQQRGPTRTRARFF